MKAFPAIYDPSRIGTLYYPDIASIASSAREAQLQPAANDEQSVHLVLIDMQVDFCHEQGSLFVPGAGDDLRRTIEFIYQYADRISQITCSLDSHLPHQIFHSAWWADEDGNHPAPFTLISFADIEAGKWRPLKQPQQSHNYVKQLEQAAKKVLTIWPYHVMIGGVGNALDPELFSSVLWHSFARDVAPTWLNKGSIPTTEHYSIVQPEVPEPDQPLSGKNRSFLNSLSQADVVVVAGEAESHCVLETLADIVEEFTDTEMALRKIYFLSDCSSPVIHPDIDFHALALEQFAKFEAQGVNFINSIDPLPF